MKIYLIICIAMNLIVLLRLQGELTEFKRKYPGAIFKKRNAFKILSNFIKTCIIFGVPVVNVFFFICMLFVLSDEKIEEAIEKECVNFDVLSNAAFE